SRTFLPDFYATAVAKLVGQRRVHHRRVYACAFFAFRRELGTRDVVSDVADDSGNPVVGSDGGLHSLSFRAGKGARHVAKPIAATASRCSGAVVGCGDSTAVDRDVEERISGREVSDRSFLQRELVALGTGNLQFHSRADGLG